MDPVELRVRNDPEVDPEAGTPFSSRNSSRACARAPTARLGARRDAGRPSGGALVHGHRRRLLDDAAFRCRPGGRPRAPRRPVRGADRRRRHRYRRADGARPDRRRRTRGGRRAGRRQGRRQRLPACERRRRLGGQGVVGLGGRLACRELREQLGSTAGSRPRSSWRHRRGGASYASRGGGPATPSARSSPRYGSTPTRARCGSPGCSGCSPRPGRQPAHRPQAVHRRDDDGISMALHEEGVLDPATGD